jgi:integrase
VDITQIIYKFGMPRKLIEAPLTTPTARRGLTLGVHWRAIDPDVHLGYRRGPRGGRWLVRWRTEARQYRQEVLATADDVMPADGMHVLAFNQAILRARDLVAKLRSDEAAAAAGPVLTVKDAIDEYIAERERSQGDRRRDARSRFGCHVLEAPLASITLHRLTERDLGEWRNGVSKDLARATVRRTSNDLKAALNRAARVYRDRLPGHFAVVVRNGLAVSEPISPVAREKQVLGDEDVRAVVRAARAIDEEDGWEGDLARLIIVLAATGARFSQIARMTVGDIVDGRLLVPKSRKGRGSKKRNRISVRVGRDVLDALRPVISDRPTNAPLLERWRWRQISATLWEKKTRGSWTSASELKHPWAAIRGKAGLPENIVPYSLRHSSIVRGLRAGLPIALVAAVHDTSPEIIREHYAAYITDALDDLSAAAVIPLLPETSSVSLLSRVAPRASTGCANEAG